VQSFFKHIHFGHVPLAVQVRERLRIPAAFAELLRRRYTQAIAQGVEHHIVDRPLALAGKHPNALYQQAVYVLQDHVRHLPYSVPRVNRIPPDHDGFCLIHRLLQWNGSQYQRE